MRLQRNEVMTGLLVVGTVVILVGVLVLLGAPGLFRPLVTFRVYFDNAAGIKQGAPVLLAGRKIGQVQKLYSPVSQEESRRAQEVSAQFHQPDPKSIPPAGESDKKLPKFEVRIDVQVDKNAQVYRDAAARMITLGLLGENAIDFTQGTEASGRSQDGQVFAGERTPDFSEAAAKLLDVIDPVAKEATKTMKELESTAQNLSKLTDEGSELNQALERFKTFGDHLVTLTAEDGPLTASLNNIQKISGDLANNDNIKITLQNFRDSSDRLKSIMGELGPSLKESAHNITEFTETVKAQPWRLIWPSTKKSEPAPAEGNITVRKSTKAKATPTPARNR